MGNDLDNNYTIDRLNGDFAKLGSVFDFLFDSLRPINNLSVKQGGSSRVEPVLC